MSDIPNDIIKLEFASLKEINVDETAIPHNLSIMKSLGTGFCAVIYL